MKVALMALALVVINIAACAPRASTKELAQRPHFEIAESNDGAAPLHALIADAASHNAAVFDIVEGEQAGSELIIEHRPTSRFGAQWEVAEGDLRSEFLRTDEDGKVLLTAAIDHHENALTRFDPPLISMYESLPPGSLREQEVRMRVLDLRNPKRIREQGTATQIIEHRGMRVIRIWGDDRGEPAELTAHCIRVTFRADLRLARVVRHSNLYYSEGVGLVAAEHEETITALGLLGSTSRQTILRRLPFESPAGSQVNR